MICVIPFHPGDIARAIDLLEWCIQLGRCKAHDCLLVADAAVQWSDCLRAQELAQDCFKSVELICTDQPLLGWPSAANAMFLLSASHLASRRQPFFWCEPDCIPLRAGWLDDLERDYLLRGKPFLGALVRSTQVGLPPVSLGGCAVYPFDAAERLRAFCSGTRAWDVASAEAVVPFSSDTKLIHHFWGQPQLAPTFALHKTPESSINTFTLEHIRKDAAVFHRNKDGSLIRLLKQRDFSHLVEFKQADVVSLRRAGDIIILLPLLQVLSCRERRKIRLVVHEDFVPLLESVSYVEPVAWHGNWEEPLEAARLHGATNAQVFGKGLTPDTMLGNFAKLAWASLGYKWNRYAPLVLDQRNFARERKLVKNAFKTDRPKILVKLHGNSSPCGEQKFIAESIRAEFHDIAEIVWLDEVRAERVFDLVGLMDRASCMVTVDTATLWLAHASKCPIIQLVNNSPFGASPPRGNCLLRVPYSQTPSRWQEISRVIRSTICDSQNQDMVLAFSDFTPSDQDTKRRQDAAFQTWAMLNARLFSFRGIRSSKIIGDNRDMPFVRDMIEAAMVSGGESIVVISNNDIKVDGRLRQAIQMSCLNYGCWWSYRTENPGGVTDQGADLFAFTRCWWNSHQHLFPDFLLGYWWWDDVMVRLMRWSGCGEQERLYYHEPHRGVTVRLNSPGAMHNDRLANQWLREHDEERQKPDASL